MRTGRLCAKPISPEFGSGSDQANARPQAVDATAPKVRVVGLLRQDAVALTGANASEDVHLWVLRPPDLAGASRFCRQGQIMAGFSGPLLSSGGIGKLSYRSQYGKRSGSCFAAPT